MPYTKDLLNMNSDFLILCLCNDVWFHPRFVRYHTYFFFLPHQIGTFFLACNMKKYYSYSSKNIILTVLTTGLTGLMSVSKDLAMFSLEFLAKNLYLWLFKPLKATCMPWLLDIFRPWNTVSLWVFFYFLSSIATLWPQFFHRRNFLDLKISVILFFSTCIIHYNFPHLKVCNLNHICKTPFAVCSSGMKV